jgi:glycosyltransferase involved in cell wall biosynthesis
VTAPTQTGPDTTDFVGPTGNATAKYAARNPVTRFLLKQFLREIDASILVADPGSILDVGCGEGVVTARLADVSRATVVGIDIGDDVLRVEWASRKNERVSFQAASAYELPFEDDSFDCVCALEVLEHLERPRDALAEISRVARHTVLLSVPREPLWRALHVIAGRDLRQLGNTPGHINHWSSRAFCEFVSERCELTRARHPLPWTMLLATPRPAAPAVGGTRTPRGRGRAVSSGGRKRRSEAMVRGDTLRVVYYGTYERDYPRNAQVISCLRGAGVDVTESHVSPWHDQEHKFSLGVGGATRLAAAEARLLLERPKDFDVMIVGYPGHFDMALARRVVGPRPLVFNPLLSLYDSLVLDRGRWGERSVHARVLRAVDRRAVRLADLTIADTEADADFFATLADVPRAKIKVCLVGAEERVFRPGWRPSEEFSCLFFGKLIPLHGLDTILDAARLAPEIPFRIVGSGQLDALLERNRPPNVDWVRWVDYEKLPEDLYAAGCALGIFGTTAKAFRVIPNKAYEALACGTPLITADTPAASELLTDGESALLVPPGDPAALATAIRRIAADPALAAKIGAGGLDAYRRNASEAILGARWKALLEEQVRARAQRAA